MGHAKKKMMEWDDLGLCSGNEGSVCGDCICDPALAEFINQNASEHGCKYCGKSSVDHISAPLDDVVEFMAGIINEEWTDPANELPYETAEGGYLGEILDGFDLLEEIGFVPDNGELFNDVASYFIGHDWCREGYYCATPAERNKFGWQRFCFEVKHVRRYTFWNSMEDDNPEFHPEHLPPGLMLEEIESVIRELGLVRELPTGTKYWRVQDHSASEQLNAPDRFTSPPQELAVQPNRMSPAGIPMFYGAEDFDTAVLEVAGQEIVQGRRATGVAFETLRSLNILDLIFIRRQVSYFAPDGRDWRHRTEFLRFFADEVSKPIDRDKQQHIEYVPTQVFTEYVRFQLEATDGKPVDGVRYLSSRNRRPCVVLFVDDEGCLKSREGRPQTLAYIPGSERTVSLETPRD